MSKELEYINRVVKELGQVVLGGNFGPYFNLMWEDDKHGVVLEKLVGEDGYSFKHLRTMGKDFIRKVYEDLKKDFD